jgi:RNA polymerase primary sigma factor
MIAQPISRRSSPSELGAARLGPIARARRIFGPRLKYVDHPSFDDATMRDAILAPLPDKVDDRVVPRLQSPEWFNSLPASRTGAPFWSREQEAHLFRKMNFLKRRANRLEEQLDWDWPNRGDLDEIERLRCEAQTLKNRIVETYLRLVVSVAKTHAKVGYDLAECVSDGNLALILAVDGFDFAKGNRFSTYATRAIRNVLTRNQWKFTRRRGHSLGPYEDSLATTDSGTGEQEWQEAQNLRRSAIGRWLGRLDKREQRILESRYGIGGAPGLTLLQIGVALGISKERVRQIEIRAQVKLRKFAEREAFEHREILGQDGRR